MENLILIGAGGYAKSVLDSIDYYNYKVVGFIDEFSNQKEHLGYPIVAASLEEMESPCDYFYFIAIGDNHHRKAWYDKIEKHGLRLINVVDKSALVSQRAIIGNGCFIGKMAIINSKAVVKNNCIINSKALVEHGSFVSDHVNISTNAVINGDVKVGIGSFIGSCSVTNGQVVIGEWSVIGAGAVVTKNVSDRKVVAGVPARIIREETGYYE